MIISERISRLREEIDSVCQRVDRKADEITILAASKQKSHIDISDASGCGIENFGENYLQEAETKMEALPDESLSWHFIGRIQSNKTKKIAERFDWVQTVDRMAIAERLSNARERSSSPAVPLNVCIQVNLDNEPQKAGVSVEELPDLISQVSTLPYLNLRGLMAIPQASQEETDSRAAFALLRRLFEDARCNDVNRWDTLSMGMSMDYRIAIEEGATMIRLGTTIFGPR